MLLPEKRRVLESARDFAGLRQFSTYSLDRNTLSFRAKTNAVNYGRTLPLAQGITFDF
jgi:hypothetical protein